MSWASRVLAEWFAAPRIGRRLSNATHAFVHGHTARDYDRARRSRLWLLGLRLASRQRSRLAWMGDDIKLDVHPSVDPTDTRRLAEDAHQDLAGLSAKALLIRLHVDRIRLETARIRPQPGNELPEDRREYLVDVFGPAGTPRKFHGKLFAGLGEGFSLGFFDDELGFWARFGHRVILSRLRRIKSAFRRRV